MAIYNHRCENEECEMEVFQDMRPMSEHDKEIPCPLCENITVKCISVPTFHLKGGCWFRDGYGTTDSKGRPIGKSVPVTSLASSTASKSHKK